MLQDFTVGLLFRRLQKRFHKIRFFLHCIQDSPISSFHPQKIQLYTSILRLLPPLCKGHLSIFDLCWGDFTTPSYYIGHLFQIFNHPRGSAERKHPFSTPYGSCCPLSSAGSRATITGGTLFHGQGNGNQDATAPESHKISHKSSYKFQQSDTFSAIMLSDPRFHGSPAVLFHKARKASSGVPHDREAKDQVYSNVRPGPMPRRNFQGKSYIKSR